MKPLIDRGNSCCFSGYRPEKLPWRHNEEDPRCVALKARIDQAVLGAYRRGFRHFLCGMALGGDTYFCESVLKLRAVCPDVTIEAAIPCETQAARWPEEQRSRYFRLLAQCDYETFVSRRYTSDCMMKRNRYMVERASLLIAVYDGHFGGTMHTVGYAERRGLEVIRLPPVVEAAQSGAREG